MVLNIHVESHQMVLANHFMGQTSVAVKEYEQEVLLLLPKPACFATARSVTVCHTCRASRNALH